MTDEGGSEGKIFLLTCVQRGGDGDVSLNEKRFTDMRESTEGTYRISLVPRLTIDSCLVRMDVSGYGNDERDRER